MNSHYLCPAYIPKFSWAEINEAKNYLILHKYIKLRDGDRHMVLLTSKGLAKMDILKDLPKQQENHIADLEKKFDKLNNSSLRSFDNVSYLFYENDGLRKRIHNLEDKLEKLIHAYNH